jgi:hypothetical protein
MIGAIAGDIITLLDFTSYEDSVRNTVPLGGESDTLSSGSAPHTVNASESDTTGIAGDDPFS